MKRVEITSREAGQRLDKFLRRFLPSAGSGFLYRMLRKKNIVLNRARASGNEILRPGDAIELWFSDETYEKLSRATRTAAADDPALDPAWILYEDRDLLVLNKPAGVLSQRAGRGDVSLVEMLRSYLIRSGQRTPEEDRYYAPGVLNRLDRNTSGIVLAAKSLPAARRYTELLAQREIKKIYLALVEGSVTEPAQLSAFLKKDAEDNRVRICDSDDGTGKAVEMKIRPVAAGPREGTLLEVLLLTGRTHQIRAQLAALGHPIVGDPKYGRRSRAAKRQMLHAWKLCLPGPDQTAGPVSPMELRAPLPEDMKNVLQEYGIRIGESGLL